MTDNDAKTPSDDFEPSAADFHTPEDTETEEKEPETKEETPAKDSTDEAEEAEETADDSEEESTESTTDDDTPSLDDEVTAALKGSPELISRWKNHWKGLEKATAKINANIEGYNHFASWERALGNKETAPMAVKELLQTVTKLHGLSVADLTGTESAKAPETDEDFEYPGEKLAYERAKADAKKEIFDMLGLENPQDLKNLLTSTKATEQAKQEEARKKAWLDEHAKPIIAKADKTLSGWKVTRDMVATSREQFPKDEATTALKRAFPDEYANHLVSASKKVETPNMVSSKTGRAISGNPNVEDLKAEHIYATMHE